MELIQTQLTSHSYWDEQHKLLSVETTSLGTQVEYTEEMYYKECLDHLEVIKKYRPKSILYDFYNSSVISTPDMQDWYNQNITPYYQSLGVEKIATVLSLDFVTSLATEQLVEDIKMEEKVQHRFFSSYDEAMIWLRG